MACLGWAFRGGKDHTELGEGSSRWRLSEGRSWCGRSCDQGWRMGNEEWSPWPHRAQTIQTLLGHTEEFKLYSQHDEKPVRGQGCVRIGSDFHFQKNIWLLCEEWVRGGKVEAERVREKVGKPSKHM